MYLLFLRLHYCCQDPWIFENYFQKYNYFFNLLYCCLKKYQMPKCLNCEQAQLEFNMFDNFFHYHNHDYSKWKNVLRSTVVYISSNKKWYTWFPKSLRPSVYITKEDVYFWYSFADIRYHLRHYINENPKDLIWSEFKNRVDNYDPMVSYR